MSFRQLLWFALRFIFVVPLSDCYSDELTERAIQKWEAHSAEIDSCRIVYRKVNGWGKNPMDTVSVEEFRRRVQPLHERLSDIQAMSVVRSLDSGLKALTPPWGDKVFVLSGKKVRDNMQLNGHADNHVSTPKAIVRFRSKYNQIHVFRNDNSPLSLPELSDFRLTPTNLIPAERIRSMLIAKADADEQTWLEGAGRRILFNKETGFVHEYSTGTPQNRFVLTLQFQPTVALPGIVFPWAIVRGRFRGGKLDSIDLVLFDELEINREIDDQIFRVAAGLGTTLLDQRVDLRNPKRLWPVEVTDDILSIIDAPEKTRKSPN